MLHLPSCIAGILVALLFSVVVSLALLSGALSRQTSDDTHIRIPALVGEIYLAPEALGIDHTLYSFRVEYVSSVKQEGKIIKQSPAAGKLVKKGDEPIEIALTVSRRKTPKLMPNVSSLPETAAIDYLNSLGIEVKTVYEPHNYLPDGYVTRTQPAAGEKIKKEIILYVSGNKE
jgi:beta-lactam-binding protein with PASTA domain